MGRQWGIHAASWAGERQGGSGFPAGGNAQAQPVAKPSSAEEDGWKTGGGKILENGSLAILRLEELARCSALKA